MVRALGLRRVPPREWELAKMYRNGELPDDAQRTQYVKWLRAAAESGIPEAMRDLSSAYFYGRLVPRNDRLAVQWIKKAAETGDPLSEFRYAASLESGLGCRRDLDAANAYYRKFETEADATCSSRSARISSSASRAALPGPTGPASTTAWGPGWATTAATLASSAARRPWPAATRTASWSAGGSSP
ncbi:tetratricopeptide repeat protein [Candidatus Methanomethylophilus sp. 1R26]|uniref:tetratricopeptide repeat protein n=1 Tax=Candidatus Methanomethylophilus sp. 1R26 TaxID=1769296 RepID=UPI001F479DE1|nr:tetratricopeptide repeat protein [Candidatus Methanomethylophilus sp. 1R26]